MWFYWRKKEEKVSLLKEERKSPREKAQNQKAQTARPISFSLGHHVSRAEKAISEPRVDAWSHLRAASRRHASADEEAASRHVSPWSHVVSKATCQLQNQRGAPLADNPCRRAWRAQSVSPTLGRDGRVFQSLPRVPCCRKKSQSAAATCPCLCRKNATFSHLPMHDLYTF